MAFENSLRRLGLPPQCAGEDGVKSNLTPREVAAQKARLSKADFGEAVVMIRAEGGLPMTDEIEGSHVVNLRGERDDRHDHTTVASAVSLLHGKSNATIRPPPSRLAN